LCMSGNGEGRRDRGNNEGFFHESAFL
jgi:hypothetical protein